jgi:Sec-independent protein translocase protein TatA
VGIGSTEILIIFLIFVILIRGSRLRELTKFGGLAYAFKYPGPRVVTRVVHPPSAFEWITIAVVIVLTILVVFAA